MLLDSKCDKGTFIFGGIDTEKYTGKLQRYPIDTRGGQGLKVNLQKNFIDNKSPYEVLYDQPFLLGSCGSFNIFPKNLMIHLDKIFKPYQKVRSSNGKKICVIDCKQPTDKFIKFDFGINTIALSYSDAVLKVPGRQVCILGFYDQNERKVLGDVFLRNS